MLNMHKYEANISWNRNDAVFADKKYSRAHEWSFDGGIKVKGSSSPFSVPPPYSAIDAIDPEEAVVAAASSCHMLWFLAIAAKHGYIVDTYTDSTFGVMEKNELGKLYISKITLRPRIEFSGDKIPSNDEINHLHHLAHEECGIAYSLKAKIVIE